jgi:hypothetical protein
MTAAQPPESDGRGKAILHSSSPDLTRPSLQRDSAVGRH